VDYRRVILRINFIEFDFAHGPEVFSGPFFAVFGSNERSLKDFLSVNFFNHTQNLRILVQVLLPFRGFFSFSSIRSSFL